MLDELGGLGAHCAEVLETHGCASASVAVVERGEVVLAEAYGLADVESDRRATTGTAYLLASATKSITATAVCLAADEGLLDLDGTVPGDYAWSAPTIRQLLQHRGGFSAHLDFHYGDGELPVDADRYARLYRQPGTGFEYANLGYRIVSRMLETASGQDLGTFVRQRVFEPLGLAGCHLGATHPGPAPTASRYTTDGRAYPVCDTSLPGAALGWATATELALFAHSHTRLLKPDTATAMHTALPISAHLGYGLGWCVSRGDGDGPAIHSHGGGMGGVAAMMITVPERELSVAVLCNSTNKAARDSIVEYVMTRLVPEFTLDQVIVAGTDPVRPLELTEGDWAGSIDTYEGQVPLTVRILTGRQVEVGLGADGGATVTAPAAASRRWDLQAVLPLQLPTADARINSPSLLLSLRLEQDRLAGVAWAFKDGDTEGLLGNFLSHPCELEPR
ncbi:serine hydrolase domain-containing protein [Kitasatospora sp. MAP5-34]|uniref:serine hydrolase domain-containing protein n=1 Tax=Kitasatospora sp. MAP5-34 TaxID=3035102 RepID=UPI002473DE89|nr:serine hydrolase domain-containing protein [Kitasatospora sp. MAP5-34]MDH6577404.1 CubicO group peptidase (beta-lactamase class C family) [Kitasatospora sp. MAP5-34]